MPIVGESPQISSAETRGTMIRRALVAAAVAVPLALAPMLLAAPGGQSDRGPAVGHGPLKDKPRADRDARPRDAAHYLLRGTLTADATATTVPVRVRGANPPMRAALGDAAELDVAIDATTMIRRGHRGRVETRRGRAQRGKRARTYANLTAGDRVMVRFRAEPGTTAAELPAAELIVDHGRPKPVTYRLRGVVAAPAGETAVSIDVRSANRHMRRAHDGASPFTAKIGESTRIRLAGRARPDGTRRAGTFSDLASGDRVIVKLRAPRGLDADTLPAARRIIDIGPAPAPESD